MLQKALAQKSMECPRGCHFDPDNSGEKSKNQYKSRSLDFYVAKLVLAIEASTKHFHFGMTFRLSFRTDVRNLNIFLKAIFRYLVPLDMTKSLNYQRRDLVISADSSSRYFGIRTSSL